LNKIANLLEANSFARTLVDSLPCGLLVVDRQGRVQVVNDILENVLKVNKKAALGKGTGNALGCFCVNDHPKDCGFGDCCKDCEVQKLTLNSLSTKQKQRTRAHLQIIIDGQVRNLDLLISAFPFTLNKELFSILIIENLGTLRAFVPDDTKEGFRGIVGRSSNMLELFDTIRQVARTDAPVLIQGESGTGKELVALAVHKESTRAQKNFVPVNCGALPEGLLESELFRHVKGAFTGAHRDRKGRFELADGGTIFLDEVGELSPTTQVKLLRVLQDGCFEPVGSEHTVRELINTMKFALAKCHGQKIEPEHLPPTLQVNMSRLYTSRHREPKLKPNAVVEALKKSRGNRCRAAEILGVSRSTLYRFFDKQERRSAGY
jgi:transcriptional regulator with PAS, ATPase and Fis domain